MWRCLPRWEQMGEFLEACKNGAFANREEAFLHIFAMDREQLQVLHENGLFSLDAPVGRLEEQWEQANAFGIGVVITDTLGKLSREYPVARVLHVEHFLMDEQDVFGRERLQGVSAYTTYEGSMCLIVWPDVKVERVLRSVVVHEYHHHWRISALGLQESSETLLERLVLEGLAEHFVAEVLGEEYQGPWVQALNEQEVTRLWPLYREHLQETGAVADSYLFGSKELSVPFWGGYAMGYELVRQFRAEHQDMTLEQLTCLPAEEYGRFFRR